MNVDVELLRHLEPIKRLTRRRLEGLVDFAAWSRFRLVLILFRGEFHLSTGSICSRVK